MRIKQIVPVILLLCASAAAQVPRNDKQVTVATLPSVADNKNKTYVVTDASTTSDCTVGGGSLKVACRSDGSTWTSETADYVPKTISVNTTSPLSGGGSLNADKTLACATCTITIASGTAALGTSAITSGACATAVTATATGTATTDVLLWGFNSDPTGVTGYQPTTNGMLTIIVYPTTNTFNAKVCNNTAASITPGAVTLNFRVVR